MENSKLAQLSLSPAAKFTKVLIARSICHRQPQQRPSRGDLFRSHGRSPISSSYFSRLVINAVTFQADRAQAICSSDVAS